MINYPWIEVDNPVELYNYAGFAILETKFAVSETRTRSKQVPGETAGLPDAHVTLQVTSVLVLSGFLWKAREFNVSQVLFTAFEICHT